MTSPMSRGLLRAGSERPAWPMVFQVEMTSPMSRGLLRVFDAMLLEARKAVEMTSPMSRGLLRNLGLAGSQHRQVEMTSPMSRGLLPDQPCSFRCADVLWK